MAIEKYGHFDSALGDKRALTASSWAKYVSMFLGTGIRNGGSNLQVTSPHSGMIVRVNQGIANINGYGYWLEPEHAEDSSYLELPVPEGHPSQSRIDRVVLRLDLRMAERKIYLAIKPGEAAQSPVAPELERNANIYEIALGKIKVAAGALSIAPESITDERLNPAVCGIINSLITADTAEMYQDFQDAFTALVAEMKTDFQGLEETFYDMLVKQEQAFGTIFQTMNDKIASVETDITALQSFDPDNAFELPGTKRVTIFQSDGSIVDTVVKNADGLTVMERLTEFLADKSIKETVTLFQGDGTTIHKKRAKITVFRDTGIEEEVSNELV